MELSRKLGHIIEFLKVNTYRFNNPIVVRDRIEYGMKLLVCEILLGGKGFSAILIFRYRSLRVVKYRELYELKDTIEK